MWENIKRLLRPPEKFKRRRKFATMKSKPSSQASLMMVNAIHQEDEGALRQALNQGASPHALIAGSSNPYVAYPALLSVLLKENLTMAQILFAAGASPNQMFEVVTPVSKTKDLPLQHVLRHNLPIATRWLLDHGAKVIDPIFHDDTNIHPLFEVLALSFHDHLSQECLEMVVEAAPPLSSLPSFLLDHLLCYLHMDSDRALECLWKRYGHALFDTPLSCGSCGLHVSVNDSASLLSVDRFQWMVERGANMHWRSRELGKTPWELLNERRDHLPKADLPRWDAFLLQTKLAQHIDLEDKQAPRRAKM